MLKYVLKSAPFVLMSYFICKKKVFGMGLLISVSSANRIIINGFFILHSNCFNNFTLLRRNQIYMIMPILKCHDFYIIYR